MNYEIVTISVADTNPIVPVDAGPMAPGKPFVNAGSDDVAVYPEGDTMAEAEIIRAKEWTILPKDWTNVKIRTAGDTNVFLSCRFTIIP